MAGQGAPTPSPSPPPPPLWPSGVEGAPPLTRVVSAQAFLASWGKADMGVGRRRVCARVSRWVGLGL